VGWNTAVRGRTNDLDFGELAGCVSTSIEPPLTVMLWLIDWPNPVPSPAGVNGFLE
jgi:hypothetical protein